MEILGVSVVLNLVVLWSWKARLHCKKAAQRIQIHYDPFVTLDSRFWNSFSLAARPSFSSSKGWSNSNFIPINESVIWYCTCIKALHGVSIALLPFQSKRMERRRWPLRNACRSRRSNGMEKIRAHVMWTRTPFAKRHTHTLDITVCTLYLMSNKNAPETKICQPKAIGSKMLKANWNLMYT